ncbi:MAG: hypothetical protein KatS3mg010_1184 [Acidimicrobiia bacterium]|nr:MAG: hypothetical protein KatS3mg010_1184 [Acidimicrobiia bacterium]
MPDALPAACCVICVPERLPVLPASPDATPAAFEPLPRKMICVPLGRPDTSMPASATLRPVLPTPIPMLMTVAICVLSSPPPICAACVMVVFARLPVAPASPVPMPAVFVVPSTPPLPAAAAPFAPEFAYDTPTFTTSAIWTMSTAPCSVAWAAACWSIALDPVVPTPLAFPVVTPASLPTVEEPVPPDGAGEAEPLAVAVLLPVSATAVPPVLEVACWSLTLSGAGGDAVSPSGPPAPAGGVVCGCGSVGSGAGGARSAGSGESSWVGTGGASAAGGASGSAASARAARSASAHTSSAAPNKSRSETFRGCCTTTPRPGRRFVSADHWLREGPSWPLPR